MNSHRSMGSVFQQEGSANWWIQYWRNGERFRESSGSQKRSDAVALLKQRVSEIQQGKAVGPAINNTTFNDLMEMVQNDYAVNRRRNPLGGRFKNLGAFFGHDLAVQITADRITAYVRQRLADGAAPATINRDLATLRRGFNLAARAGRVGVVPYFSTLKEDNARKGFFDREHLHSLLPKLPAYLQPLLHTAYLTGWRVKSELMTRRLVHLDLKAGWLRLDPGETKNGQGRMFPLTPELRSILEAQVAETRRLEREQGRIIPWLFHRNGQPIRSYRKAWATACKAAGIPGALVHDFRRTAVRNLERQGVSRSAAMSMTGHLTEAVYRRYAIVDEATLKDAALKMSVAQ